MDAGVLESPEEVLFHCISCRPTDVPLSWSMNTASIS